MNIAIITYYAVTNIGDRILTDTLKYLLCDHNVDIIDINGRYAYRMGGGLLGKIEKFYANRFIKRKTDLDIHRYFENALKDKQLIIFGGGQVANFKYTDCCKRIAEIVAFAEKSSIPVAFHAIGMAGSDFSSSYATMFKKALNSDVVINASFRERYHDVVNNLVTRQNLPVSLIADTAVWCRECYGLPVHTRNQNEKFKVGINIIKKSLIDDFYGVHDNSVVDIYCRLYYDLSSIGYDVRFFTNGVARDNETLLEVMKKLSLTRNKVAKFKLGNGKSFLQMLNQFDFIVSSRLHTSICSYSLKIPTVAFAWDEKFKEFYSNINCSENCVNDLHYDSILEKIFNMNNDSFDQAFYDSYRKTVIDGLSFISEKFK